MIGEKELQDLRARCRAYPSWLPESWRQRVRTGFRRIWLPRHILWTVHEPHWAPLLAHEGVHLGQQEEGSKAIPYILRFTRFMAVYATKRGRLASEAPAVAAEIEQSRGDRQAIFDTYCFELAGESYSHAASSKRVAGNAIRLALIARGCDWVPQEVQL